MRFSPLVVAFLLSSCNRPDPAKEKELVELRAKVAELQSKVSMSATKSPEPPIVRPAPAPQPTTAVSLVAQAVMSNSPNDEIGKMRIKGIDSFLHKHLPLFQRNMRARKKLKPDEYLYDQNGLIRDDKFLDLVEFAQEDTKRFYGSKTNQAVMESLDNTGELPLVVSGGLFLLNVPELRAKLAANKGKP